jgi:hypothetical protein
MAKDYNERKDQVADILREKSTKGRDIGAPPPVANPERREACRLSLRLFCETYCSAVFYLGWSDDHLRVIEIIENAVLHGGLFAVAMPRGSGKTALSVAAAEWALLFGHRSFVVLIGATERHATRLLKNIKADLEYNDLLAEDFPEVCYPIRRLEGISHRAAGQLLDGARTHIVWKSDEIVLPTVKGSKASGAIVKVAGLTGAIRGMQVKRPSDNSLIRPDFVIPDDPQTKDSAKSLEQTEDRMRTINGDVILLSGPGKKISAVMPITVIVKGDLADQSLDREKAPDWQGVRTKLLKSPPTDDKLWEQYAEIRAESLRKHGDISEATEFYKQNREAMDVGAVPSWSLRFDEDEISAIQNCMNLKLRDPISFAAECQNDPLSPQAENLLNLKPEQIAAKALPIKRGTVPAWATKLTAFIDVQGSLLYYVVCAWGNDFSGHIVDYGCWPEQRQNYFFLRNASPTFAEVMPGTALEGQIYGALQALVAKLLDRDWECDDGKSLRIGRLLIDSGYRADIVKQYARESGSFRSLIIPSKGYGVGPEQNPMDQWTIKDKEGDRRGWSWLINKAEGHVLYDTNIWKTFIAQRFVMSAGEIGNLSLFEGSPTRHKLFMDHATSEYTVRTEGKGRIVFVWKLLAGRENHLLDGIVGCAVAASEQGILFTGHQPSTGQGQRKRRRFNVKF